MKKAIVLLSGGVDSATTLYLAKDKGYELFCLIFDYNQRHRKEIEAAREIARKAEAKFAIVEINFPRARSSLLDKNLSLKSGGGKIPLTYVPARNIIFLAYATAYAETLGARTIFIGANQVDYSGYPDCRKSFIHTFNRMIKKGTKSGVQGKKIKVVAPLIKMSKGEIIKLGIKLGVPYEDTWSCYEGGKSPCLECDSCKFRLKGFQEAGVEDPLLAL